MKSLRVVLDTNCVVSALLFDGRLAWLRAAWQNGKITPLVSQATMRELLRVLAYPKFQLSANEREDVLEEFLLFAETVAQPAATSRIPQIRDPHDQAFLELAINGGADALVTGDSDLLVIASQISLPILRPAELRERVAGP